MWRQLSFLASLVAIAFAQPPIDPCRGCRMDNGVGYKNHETRCDLFYQCRWADASHTTYNALIQHCPCGQFWNQEWMTCGYTGTQACQTDPCAGGAATYPHAEFCKAYWTCNDRRTSGTMCCAQNERYDSGSARCVVDNGNTCNEPCPCRDATTAATPECHFAAVSGDAASYSWNTVAGRVVMKCAPGTNFNPASCKCDTPVSVVSDCMTTGISFGQGRIMEAKGVWFYNRGVTINNDVGVFDGSQSYLHLPRYSNVDWRMHFAIEIEFNAQSGQNSNGHLFYNSDCNEPASIIIRLVGANVRVTIITDGNPGSYTLDANYRSGQWNTLKVMYDGNFLRMSVTVPGSPVASESTSANGNIRHTQCAVKIGWADGSDYFNGQMRKINIYKDCTPPNFIN